MKKELSKNCRRIIVASMGMILISTGTGLVSCAASTDPAAFGRKAQTEVKKGMTKDQVREILGTPLAVSSYNGEENWHYQKNNMLKIIGTETNNVVVRFNTNGRVKGTSNSGVATAY